MLTGLQMMLHFPHSRMAPAGLCANIRSRSASLSTPQSTPQSSISRVFLGFHTTDKLPATELPAYVNDWASMQFKIWLGILEWACLSESGQHHL